MGQTNNTTSYHHRLNILSNLMNPPQAKSMLMNRTPILQSQDSDLFGKEFRQHLKEKVKVKTIKGGVQRNYVRQTKLHENEALSKRLFPGNNIFQNRESARR